MGRNKSKYRSKSRRCHNSGTKYKTSSDPSSYCATSSNADDLATGANTSQDSSESDIPGYYYDPEKKAYFKILPSHLGPGGNFVTRETINKGRKSDNKQLHERLGARNGSTSSTIPQSVSKKSKDRQSSLINHSIYSAQIGQVSGNVFKRHFMLRKFSGMFSFPGWSTSDVTLSNFDGRLEALQRMELNSKHDKAVCVWSVESDLSQRIQLMSISLNRKSKVYSENRGSFPVKIEPSKSSYTISCSSKISCLCWSPLSSCPGELCILYSVAYPLGDFSSKVSITNLQAKERHKVDVFDFSLGRGAVWSCAWNQIQNRFSVGCERKCHVVDVTGRRQWIYSTCNSDALSQSFSKENPHILYSGTRSGLILIHDLRSAGPSQISAKFNQKMPVVCIRSPKDENYMFASDFSGSICSWDLRMKNIVMKYSGLTNSHYLLPFYLDETEHIIYGTGSDSFCKIWDLFTGKVVKTIAPPFLDLSQDCMPTFPITHVSGHWAGLNGVIGAITGMGKQFFLSY